MPSKATSWRNTSQLGGPVNSDLGFPIANESDGGVGPSSKIVTFSAADKPVIFWTPDHGAFVVRGAMKAAWDKLKGPTGKLGAPVGDQATDGDVVSQKFTGGKISWNRAKNTFTTDPANLAPLLSGLQVSGQNQPSGSAMPAHAKKFTWHWWYLLGVIPVLSCWCCCCWWLFGGADVAPAGISTPTGMRPRASSMVTMWTRVTMPQPPGSGLARTPNSPRCHGSGDDMPPSEHLSEDERPGQISWPRGAEAAAAVADDAASAEAYDDEFAVRTR